jgi:cytochrome P450
MSLKHPSVWKQLEADILAAPFAQPGHQQLPAPYAQARAIPYLEAVIKESLRLVPGNMFSQERYVPAGGLPLPSGAYVPAGTAVGFSAWVLHRNPDIWGADAAAFRPERYLRAAGESEAQHAARLRLYGDSDLSFGAGSRRCIGMNLGLMKVYKTVATLVALFEFKLADPDKDWELKAELFPRATGVELCMRLREGMALPE